MIMIQLNKFNLLRQILHVRVRIKFKSRKKRKEKKRLSGKFLNNNTNRDGSLFLI
jgi:hypothetical protein